ncbi:MAG: PIN domain-containing protein, partial [Acidimicrobiia bacterium]
VLDASAALAWLQGEVGAGVVAPLLDGAVIAAPNLAEVLTKVLAAGVDTGEATAALVGMGVSVEPFTAADALGAARWWTVEPSLSLGDRACLAVAGRLNGRAVTADTLWGDLPDAEVLLIR